MSELISVQPAKPGDGTNMAYSGLSGVWYTDQERDSGLKVFFAVTMRSVVMPDGEIRHGTLQDAMEHMQSFINWHVDGLMEIHHQCLWQDPADQRQPGDRNAGGRQMFVNKGYKVKRMVDEDKVYYEIAFKMSNGKEAQHPAKIFNESYLKMLAKALSEAGHEPHKWESGKAHMIDIEFGVTKSDKVGDNGKAYNNYEYFKVVG